MEVDELEMLPAVEESAEPEQSRFVDDGERDSKRLRLMSYNLEEREVEQVGAERDAQPKQRKLKSLFNFPGKQMSVHAMMDRKALGLRVGLAQSSYHFLFFSFLYDTRDLDSFLSR